MRIIPVMDLMGGAVVRAVAGRRHEYRPIISPLVDSPDPTHVAARLLEVGGATELYVADLDAITSGQPVTDEIWNFLNSLGVKVLFDGGFRAVPTQLPLSVRPVLASETFGLPPVATEHAAYSVDLRAGQLVGSGVSPAALAELAVAAGFRTLIVLDIARVGTGTGTGTEPLIREIRRWHPRVELIAGGGVRTRDDLARLADAGADAALVASALHDGRLTG